MKVDIGPPYALCLGLFYVCTFSTTICLDDKKKRFREFYIAGDREEISSHRNDKILELMHGLNEKGIYPPITS